MDISVTQEMLLKADSPLIDTLIKLFTDEEIGIVYEVSPAVRNCDNEEMIHVYGHYAAMLQFVLVFTDKEKKGRPNNLFDIRYPSILYRGLSLEQIHILFYRQLYLKGKMFRMRGMFSSSYKKRVAINMANLRAGSNKTQVIFVIQFGHCRQGHFRVEKDQSPFPKEEEVIVMDHCDFWVTGMKIDPDTGILQIYLRHHQYGEMSGNFLMLCDLVKHYSGADSLHINFY